MKENIRKICITAGGTLRQALEVIDRGTLGAALVVEPGSGRFRAVLTDGDVRRALLRGCTFNDPLERAIPPGGSVTARTDTPFNEILELFSPAIRIVPILDAGDQVVDIALFDKRRFFPVAEPDVGEKEWQYVSECVLSGWISSTGSFVPRFERAFADFCGVEHAIATSSGTTALHLALLACGAGPGDEVIVPTLSFIATANAVAYTGATPVFADSDPVTWNIDPAGIEPLVTPRTKAIIAVHLYGHPADMEAILAIASRHGLLVIEDAAEAHGALYRGQRVGSMGDLGIFSFFGNKIVTTGEGGMVVTGNRRFADRVRLLRDHGMDPDRRYWHTTLGYNYRLTNMQAAVGLAQMEKIDAILLRKRQNARAYAQVLREVPGITLPPEEEWAENVYWLYSILVDEQEFGMSRDMLMERLREQGIETRPFFHPIHRQPVYDRPGRLEVAQRLAACGLSLPSSTRLSSGEIRDVAHCIKELQG